MGMGPGKAGFVGVFLERGAFLPKEEDTKARGTFASTLSVFSTAGRGGMESQSPNFPSDKRAGSPGSHHGPANIL